ncbi:MAG: hypothetical protein WCB12_13015 [Bryobacteraceae bacterium]
MTSIAGTFQTGETLNDSTSGGHGVVSVLCPPGLDMGQVDSSTVSSTLSTTQANIGLTGISGTYGNGDRVIGSVSGATGIVTGGGTSRGGIKPVSVMGIAGTFVVGETLTDSTSGAHGTINSIQAAVGVAPASLIGGTTGHIGANTLTGSNLGSGTVAGSNVAAQTLAGGSTGNLALLTVVSGNVANLAITYVQIASLTIGGGSSGQVAPNTLLTGQIEANTLTGGLYGNLALQTITGGSTGSNLANSTVTGNNYASASVSSTAVASLTLTGGANGNLALATATGGNLANATVTYLQVASSTLTGSQIALSTITNGHIIGLDPGKLTAGTISAAVNITAGGSITCLSLEIGVSPAVIISGGQVNVASSFLVGNQQVVGARQTGPGSPASLTTLAQALAWMLAEYNALSYAGSGHGLYN